MFPLYDDNPNLRFPIATAVLIALNVVSWVFLQGLGSGPSLAESLCAYGLIPGDLLGKVPVGTRLPLTETLLLSARRFRNLVHPDYLHVYAWRLDAHYWQPMVPLGIRRQH